jgi:hypothetical protein
VSRNGHGTKLIRKYKMILRCAQILRCLKSKYLSFFPARRVFRYAGMDVRLSLDYTRDCIEP